MSEPETSNRENRENCPQDCSDAELFAATSSSAETQIVALQAQNAALQQQVEHLTQALATSAAQHQLSETRLDQVLRSTIAAITRFRVLNHQQRQYLDCSESCEVVFGYTAQEFLHDVTLWRSQVLPEQPEEQWAIETVLSKALSAEEAGANPSNPNALVQIEYRFQDRNGAIRWIREVITSHCQTAEGWMVTTVAIDISEHKFATEALRHSRDYIQRITDHSPQLLYIFDLVAQRNVYVNHQVLAILGYTPAEIDEQGATFFVDRWHPDDLDTIQQTIERFATLADGVFVELKYRMRHKDGSWRWLSARDVVFERDEAGNPTKTLGTAIDITQRMQLEEDLRQSQTRYQVAETHLNSILNRADASIVSYRMLADSTWEYDYHSAGCETVFGFTAAEMMQGVWWERIPPEDQQTVILPSREYIFAEQAARIEYRFWHKDGSLRWIASTRTSQYDETLGCWHVIAIDTDITDRKQLELALKQSEACNRAIIEAIPDLLLRVTLDGTCLECILPQNPDAAATFTFVPIQHLSEVLPPDLLEMELHAIQQAILTRQLQTYELQLVKNGRLVYEEVRIAAIDRSNEALLIVRDIGARKQAEFALQRQLEKEQTLNRVIQTIHNSLDLHTIFSTVVTEVANFLQVDQVGIIQYLPAQSIWRCVAEHLSQGEVSSIRGIEISDQENQIATYLKQFQVIRADHTCQLKFNDAISQELIQRYPGSWLIVPLQIGARVWGGLELMQGKERNHVWQDAEVELVQAMVDQIAMAIQQSELYQQVTQFNISLEHQVEQRTAELQQALEFEARLKRITDKVRDSLDENQILQVVVEELALLPDVRYCNTALYDAEQQTVIINHTANPHRYNNLSYSRSEPILSPTEFPEVYTQFQQGLSFQFCSSSSKLSQDWVMALGCPIIDNQMVLGDLLLIKARDAVFNNQEIRLIQQVANQCAIALRQSRLYQAVQSHAKELESLNRLKDEFLNTVSHELRSPMANIKMAIQLLEVSLDSLAVLDGRSNRYFQILKEECDRETNLINDLLDLSRLESGRIELSLTSLDLEHWIPHVAEGFEVRARNQQQKLFYRFQPNLPPLVTDGFYLQRILSELLHNACKYTPVNEQITILVNIAEQNQEHLDQTLSLKDCTGKSLFKISVVNTGVEIPRSEFDRIFDKFYRIPNNDPWKHGGTGLGLALVKKLTECLGGTIQLECCNRQTQFTILVPSQHFPE